MASEIVRSGDLGPEQEDGYERFTDTVVVASDARYVFPTGYDFKVDGGSLLVFDEAGVLTMAIADGSWGAAILAGTAVVVEEADDEDDD